MLIRRYCVSAWLLLPLLLAPSATVNPAEPMQRVVSIGFAAPLSELSPQSARNAALLAIEEINKSNPRINGEAIVFQLQEEDDKSDARITEYIARTFVNSKVIGVVGHWSSAMTMIAAPIYYEGGLAQISPASWSAGFTQKSFRTAFQIIGSDDTGLKFAAGYLVGEQQLKRVFIVDDGAYLGTTMADTFSRHVKTADGEVVYHATVNGKTSDFNIPLQKAQQTKPDLIFFSGRLAQSDTLARNLSRFNLSAKLLITGSVITNQFLRNTDKIGNTILAVVPSTPLEKRPGMAALQKRYTERFGSDMQPFAAYAYDSVNILVAAAKKANSIDREKIINALHEVRHMGISGNIAFNTNGALLKPSYTLYQIENGKWRPVKIFESK